MLAFVLPSTRIDSLLVRGLSVAEGPPAVATMNQQRSKVKRPTPSAFGKLLKRLRLSARLTQEELAERANVSARLISDLERGVVQRSRRDTVEMLASGLGLTGTDRATFAALARRRQQAGVSIDADEQSASPVNLPAQVTAIIGREREISAITSFLLQPEMRLLTLTGPGGVGKTRLAIETAQRVSGTFSDGVVFVDLAPLTDVHLVPSAIARALAGQGDEEVQLYDEIVALIQDQHLLLLLDNMEHLIAAASNIAGLVERCPNLTALVTSRQPLLLRAEREYPVVPLGLPDRDRKPSIDARLQAPAVQLFVTRAEAAQPAFALTGDNVETISQIVTRLDGLPLAIELAAARMRLLAPAELLERIDRSLPLLTGGPRDAPERQQTLRAAIDWSYDLLTPSEQDLFSWLTVFSGGFTLDAAEFLARGMRGDQGSQTLDGLASLVEKSLIQREAHRDGPGGLTQSRFGMLETIREFAMEQLDASGEGTKARQQHAEWCIDLALRSEPGLNGPDQASWITTMQAENDNLRAALRWTIAMGEAELAMRISGPLLRFWATSSQLSEARRWYEQTLDLDTKSNSTARAKALLGAEVISYFQGDYDAALSYGREALEIYRAHGDPAGTAWSYGNLGLVADAREDYDLATELYERALTIFREIGDPVHTNFMLGNLGLIAHFQGHQERAAVLLEEALALARERGDMNSTAIALSNLGLVAFAQGDLERATELQAEALELRSTTINRGSFARSFDNFAIIAAAGQEYERAAQLFGAAEAVRAEIGAALSPNDRETNRPYIDRAVQILGRDRFMQCWEEGASRPVDDVVASLTHPARHAAQTANRVGTNE